MKTVILNVSLALMLTATLSSCAQKTIKGSGEFTTINRTTSNYDAVKCAGPMNFILVKGKEGNITLDGEANLLPYIKTEVHGNTLIVKVEDGIQLKSRQADEIKITIPFESISEVSFAGSGDVKNADLISADNFKVSLAGSGDVSLEIDSKTVHASIAGSGDLSLKGKTDTLDVDVAGSGDFHGFNLASNSTDVSVAGSGDAEVVSNTYLKGRVAGSGDISYKGHPEKEDTKVVGSGSISSN